MRDSLQARICALRSFRVNARRNIKRAQFGISDDIDRRRFIELQQMILRGTEQEWQELRAITGQSLPVVKLLPPERRRLPAVKKTPIRHAYAPLVVKAINTELREIEGVATSPNVDRLGDVVVPEGVKMPKLPFPLLWQHNHDEPVGQVLDAKVAKEGIKIRAKIAQIDEPGELKSLLDKAWQNVKTGLVRGLSIGFHPLEQEVLPSGKGLRYTKWALHEISLVTIGANADAAIHSVRTAA